MPCQQETYSPPDTLCGTIWEFYLYSNCCHQLFPSRFCFKTFYFLKIPRSVVLILLALFSCWKEKQVVMCSRLPRTDVREQLHFISQMKKKNLHTSIHIFIRCDKITPQTPLYFIYPLRHLVRSISYMANWKTLKMTCNNFQLLSQGKKLESQIQIINIHNSMQWMILSIERFYLQNVYF